MKVRESDLEQRLNIRSVGGHWGFYKWAWVVQFYVERKNEGGRKEGQVRGFGGKLGKPWGGCSRIG